MQIISDKQRQIWWIITVNTYCFKPELSLTFFWNVKAVVGSDLKISFWEILKSIRHTVNC